MTVTFSYALYFWGPVPSDLAGPDFWEDTWAVDTTNWSGLERELFDGETLDFLEEGDPIDLDSTLTCSIAPYTGYAIEIGGELYAIFAQEVNAYQYKFYIPNNDPYLEIAYIAQYALSDPVAVPLPVALDGSVANCFLEGTLIETPSGEVAIQELRVGDLITATDGRNIPVKWVGRQTRLNLFRGEGARPVRVAAGALGDGLPHTDLVLTPEHALIIDGLAVNAGALVNGASITFDPAPERATYYHIETENHDVILANGAQVETYIDYIGRRSFDNFAEYIELYGQERAIAELPFPRISTRRLLPPALKARLDGQAAA